MPDAVIVDVDGTLCDVTSVRHHVMGRRKNFAEFHRGAEQCPPHQHVVDAVIEHHEAGRQIIIVTARAYQWEESTLRWLRKVLPVPFHGPFMRGDDDYRADTDVKRDIHRVLTEDHGHTIVHALEDNPRIVELWAVLGIPTTVIPGWVDEE